MFQVYNATVNGVGPAFDDFAWAYIDEMAAGYPDGIVTVYLTSLDNQDFSNQPFAVGNPVVANRVLATGLAAINIGKQVIAAVDWPPFERGEDQNGNIVYAPVFCYGIILGGTLS